MSFANQALRDDYVGNGTTVNFGFNFPIYTDDAVQVLQDGVVLVKGTHYNVRNAADTTPFSSITAAGLPAAGIVKFVTAPPSMSNVSLIPLQAAVQQSDYVVEPFPANRIEIDFDKMVMLVRALKEQMRRALKFATKSLKVDADGMVDDPVPGRFLRAKNPGPGLDWATVAQAGSLSLPVAIADGGTGAATASGARVNLDVPSNAAALGLKSMQVFTASGTWTRPTGIRKVLVEVIGGGGGGGSTQATADQFGAGGGGGGFAMRLLDVSAIATSTITIGPLGGGGAAGSNNGAAGGNSSWADGTNTLTGNGGAGGAFAAGGAFGGAGGTGTGGSVNIAGGAGGPGQSPTATNAIGPNNGGTSQRSAGTAATTANQVGLAATGYGGGGSGASNIAATARAGGNGSAGIIIVYEYE